MKTEILTSLERRFDDIEQTELIFIATCLDPRFKINAYYNLSLVHTHLHMCNITIVKIYVYVCMQLRMHLKVACIYILRISLTLCICRYMLLYHKYIQYIAKDLCLYLTICYSTYSYYGNI